MSALGLSDCLSVVSANQRFESAQMSVVSDEVRPIFFHPESPQTDGRILNRKVEIILSGIQLMTKIQLKTVG
jgi:hypothetical protein